MKVAVNTRNLLAHTTGVQRYTKRIIDCWQSRNVDLACIQPSVQNGGLKGHLWEQFVLPLEIGKVNPSILWSPSNTGPLLCKNQIVTIHDTVPFDFPQSMSPKFVAWYKFLLPKLAARVKHIITISNFSKERIVHHLKVPESKVSVIYNGVDLSSSLINGESTTSEGKNKPFSRYILTVGSIEPRKNLPRLLKAWQLILPKIDDDIGLVIVGAKGVSRVFSSDSIDGIDFEANRIKFTGHVSDEELAALYKGALGFSFVSLYEGFGLPALEAMLYRLPVLSSNVSSMRELCESHAKLVDPYSVESIADGLESIIQGKIGDESIESSYRYASSLSWNKCASSTLACIEKYS